jgi:hypothetical protein
MPLPQLEELQIGRLARSVHITCSVDGPSAGSITSAELLAPALVSLPERAVIGI